MHPTLTRLILTTALLAAGPWQAAQAVAPFAREVPTTYGKFDKDGASLTLVVAELVATDYLKGYDCPATTRTNPDGTTTVSVCLGPGPTWFKARVLQHVAGPDIGDEFYAVTGSHWGAMKVGPAEPPRLMLLNSNGTALEMVRYKSWPVAKSKDGQFHLVLERGPSHWLPCWTNSLKQQIGDGELAGAPAMARGEYDNERAEDYPAFFRVTADGVRPRYAIPVARLQQGFKDVPLAVADFSCWHPDPLGVAELPRK